MVYFPLDIARQKQAHVALLKVLMSSAAAYRLYTRLGFDEVDIRKNIIIPPVSGARMPSSSPET